MKDIMEMKNKLNQDSIAMILADFATDGELSYCDSRCNNCPLGIIERHTGNSICEILTDISCRLQEEV